MSYPNLTRREVLTAIAALTSSGLVSAQGLVTDEQKEKQIADSWWYQFQNGQLTRSDTPHLPIDEPRFNQAMQEIARPLMAKSTRAGLDWRIGTADVDQINAFTPGGGVICMLRGLIRFCDSEVELASVIAHEVGHIQYRHQIRRLMAMRLFENIDYRIFDMSPAEMQKAIREKRFEYVAPEVIYMSYTQKREHEADAFSVRALAAAGYDLRGAHIFFEKLLSLKVGEAPLESCLMSTHPETRERVARVKGLAKRYGKQRARANSAAFEYLKRNS